MSPSQTWILEKREFFLKGCDPWQVNKAPVNGPSPSNIRTAQAGLDVLFFKTSWGWDKVDMGGVRENNDQNILNENSQGINKNIKRSIFL